MQPQNGKAKHVFITEWSETHQILFCLVKMNLPLYKARHYISMGQNDDLGHRCVWYTYRTSIHRKIVCKRTQKYPHMRKKNSQAVTSLKRLLEIIEKLRAPDGCLWDRKQKKEDIATYLLEETYELVDAIDSGSPNAQKEEMGDLLFQILFLSRISEEAHEFNIADVMEYVAEKMIRRHPHVFGDAKVKNIEEIKANWDDIKKHLENRNAGTGGLLDGIPRSLPSLLRAQKVAEKASHVGFDWARTEEVLDKIEEEFHEFKASLKSSNIHYIREEIGDLLFTLVNLCRFVDVNAEEALKASVGKFTERFSYIEKKLIEEGKDLAGATLKEMDDLWNEAKLKER